jgi:type IV secretory pathway TraG/TraD family ATPase VirD4
LRFLHGLNEDENKQAFSIRQWLEDELRKQDHQKSGWLYISSRANFHSEIKPLISAWLGLALKSIQSLEPNTNKRIWVIMDEAASLNRLEGFSDVVADIRKFGGCVALCIQSHSQLNFIYGRDEAASIMDNFNTSVYFRSPKKQVAQWVSQDLGDHNINKVRESQSYGPNAVRDGNTVSKDEITKPTVDTATIMTLENLTCFVKVAGNHPIAKIKLKYKERKRLIERGLIQREIDYDAIEKITAKAKQAETNPNRDEAVKVEQNANVANEVIAKEADMAESEKAKDLAYKIEIQESPLVGGKKNLIV